MSLTELSANRLTANGFLIDTNDSSLGGLVTITASAAGSLLLDPTLGVFDRYYMIYYIKTNAAVTVVLPTTTAVTRGWACRIVLYSTTNAGTIAINNSSGQNIYNIVSVASGFALQPRVSADVVAAKGVEGWVVIPYLYDILPTRKFVYSPNRSLLPKALTTTNFCAYSGAVGSTINVNSAVAVPIPWSTTRNGYFVDNIYFTHSSALPTQIFVNTTCIITVRALVFVNKLGGATSANRFSIAVNGSFVGFASETTSATVSLSATTTVEVTTTQIINAGSYIQLGVYKSAVSGGTNPLDQGSTCISVQAVGHS